ncbi:MAG: bacillithiol biosynthesis BshC, partial [Chitinophagia bacterium]|nr:bacillithiol biosynthesis BshC [Chitinophagia bacterium]
PDDAALKSAFAPVMLAELTHRVSKPLVAAQSALLDEHYKAQAFARDINLFYLNDQLRERIEYNGTHWTVHNTDIAWTKQELEGMLHSHPECFSPNVILRGVFQETILPNVAFIGGGAEVAYWAQLKPVFDHFGVFYPAVLLRQSVMFVTPEARRVMEAAALTVQQIFADAEELIKQYIDTNTTKDYDVTAELKALQELMSQLSQRATALDATLEKAVAAKEKKMVRLLEALGQKMYRAEKKKAEIYIARIYKIKELLFPQKGLQERVDNFMEFYLDYGPGFVETIVQRAHPYGSEVLIAY